MSFDRDAPTLTFIDWGVERLPPRDRRWLLLWPALMYRVLVSEPRSTELNLFQRAALGLCRAGVTNEEAIAARLHLDPNLVALLLRELYDWDHIDSDRNPTDLGASVYTEDHEIPTQAVAVFQDPFTGELWPRIGDRYARAPVEWHSSGPVLAHGRRPFRDEAFVEVSAEVTMPDPPTATEVLGASQSHVAAKRKARRPSASDNDDNLETEHSLDRADMTSPYGRVSFIDLDASPVFLASYLWYPAKPDDIDEWQACDPFFAGTASAFFRRQIEHRAATSDELQGLLEKVDHRALAQKLGPYRDYLRQIENEAEEAVVRRFGRLLEAHLEIEGHVVDMWANLHGADMDEERAPRLRARAMVSAQKSLEGAFLAILGAYPIDQAVVAHLKRAKKGRDVQLTPTVFDDLESKGWSIPTKIRDGSKDENLVPALRGRASLRAYVGANFLAAHQNPEHPLNRVEPSSDLLVLADRVAEARNAAAHSDERPMSAEEVNEAAEATLRVLDLVLPMVSGELGG